MFLKKTRVALATAIIILIIVIFAYFSILGHKSQTGRSAGIVSGMLTPCPEKRNCVCSEFAEDSSHFIEPLDYSGIASKEAWIHISQAIQESGGDIVVSSENYITATFSVSLFGFIDDFECRLDTFKQKIQLRSASRVGRHDLGINRKRADRIRRLFKNYTKPD